jgi:DNA-binding GntR family transcriptional regulator
VDNQQLVHDFYEARLAIEPKCAALASQRAAREPDQVAELRNLVEAAEEVIATDNVIAFIGLDIDFHATIARLSANPFLYRMLEAIIEPETDLRNVLHRLPNHLIVAHRQHERILAAIEAGDAAGARQRMTEALQGPAREIARLYEQKEETE